MQELAHRLKRPGTETAPTGPATHHLIGTEQLAAMKNSAYLGPATVEVRTAMAMLAVDETLAVPSDEPPHAPIK